MTHKLDDFGVFLHFKNPNQKVYWHIYLTRKSDSAVLLVTHAAFCPMHKAMLRLFELPDRRSQSIRDVASTFHTLNGTHLHVRQPTMLLFLNVFVVGNQAVSTSDSN